MAIASITPAAAVGAYQRVQSDSGTTEGGFGDVLERAVQGVIGDGHGAEQQATQALTGGGDLTHVVTAVSKAELGLQAATAIRDRVVSAYQDIMRMAI
jgi:flagellar hook-basal body complex protein FliE